MKKSLLLVALLSAVALLVTSCDLFGGGKADYFPTGIGSIWNYAMTVTTTMPDSADTTTATSKTEAKAEDELSSGEKVVMFVTETAFATDETYYDTIYVWKTDEKVLNYTSKDDTNPSTALEFPLERDKTWRVSEMTTAKVLAQENVTVEAGTYKNCWKLELTTIITDGDTFKTHVWHADGTGHVQSHTEFTEGGITTAIHSELTSATIK